MTAPTIRTTVGDRPSEALFESEREYVDLELRRWSQWVKGDRKADPWASGAGRGIDYTRPRVMSSRTSYGPGTAADGTEGQAALQFTDACVARLRQDHYLMVYWRYVDEINITDIAKKLGHSERWVSNQWKTIYVRLVVMLKRWEIG